MSIRSHGTRLSQIFQTLVFKYGLSLGVIAAIISKSSGRLVVYDVQNVVYGYYADNSVFAVNDRQRNKVVFSDCVGRFLLRRVRVYRNYTDGHNFVYFLCRAAPRANP